MSRSSDRRRAIEQSATTEGHRTCATGCVRARRHVSDCAGDPCRGCEPRRAEHGWLCYGCHKRLVRMLREIPGQVALLLAMADARGEHELTAPTTARLSAAGPRLTTARDVRPLYARRSTLVAGPSEPIRLACLDVAREVEDWLMLLTCRIVEDHQVRGPEIDTIDAYAAWLEARPGVVEWRDDVADRVFAPGNYAPDGQPIGAQSLASIMSRAHSLAPWRESVARLRGIPCEECHATTLVRYGGDEDVTCVRCNVMIPPARYAIWTRMLAEEHRAKGAVSG